MCILTSSIEFMGCVIIFKRKNERSGFEVEISDLNYN